MRQTLLHITVGELQIAQSSRQIGLVRGHIKMTVSTKIKDNRLGLATFLTGQRLLHRLIDGVRGFGRRQNSLGARKAQGRIKDRTLLTATASISPASLSALTWALMP